MELEVGSELCAFQFSWYLSACVMFSVVPLVPRYDNDIPSSSRYGSRKTKQRHHPDVQGDIDMELDDEEDGSGPSRIASPGEAIADSAAVLRYVAQKSWACLQAVWCSTKFDKYLSGHGTYMDNEEVVASIAGVVDRVNKLVTVRALKSR